MIYEKLGLSLENPEVISVVGAGGKSTLIKELGQELKGLKKKVLSTTTTQVFKPRDVDYFLLKNIDNKFKARKGSITAYGSHVKNDKLIGIDIEEVNETINRKIFDYILIEADGANRKPFKAPASHEPVISPLSTMTIAVIGLDAIGQILNESNFHRPRLISELIEKDLEEQIDVEDIIKVILHKYGTFKDSVGKKILILNKANSTTRVMEGNKIRDKLHDGNITVLICDIITKEFY